MPGLDGRIWGDVSAVAANGNFMGGVLFGPGLLEEAFLYNSFTGENINLNEAFADVLPEGWRLIETQHISDDGSRLFVRAQAPDGSSRLVGLEGEAIIPAPGAFALLLSGAGVMSRRRRV